MEAFYPLIFFALIIGFICVYGCLYDIRREMRINNELLKNYLRKVKE